MRGVQSAGVSGDEAAGTAEIEKTGNGTATQDTKILFLVAGLYAPAVHGGMGYQILGTMSGIFFAYANMRGIRAVDRIVELCGSVAGAASHQNDAYLGSVLSFQLLAQPVKDALEERFAAAYMFFCDIIVHDIFPFLSQASHFSSFFDSLFHYTERHCIIGSSKG
nr:hypothetical protein [uncultured Acetatifactor sp.]